jgi:oxygen-independent coproporphyrinogen-3 oxidase
MSKLGVYIHIPFCKRKCNYCDFCSFVNRQSEVYTYTDELCRRIAEFAALRSDREVDTVYFGGGTPTLLPIACFEKIMAVLGDSFDIDDNAEISVECNPATADESAFRSLRAMGINRLSMGLQSANGGELALLGRLHSFEDFCISFECARRAGFDNISVDLMYGIPDQTTESFKETLNKVIALDPEHISAYGLKIEEGTVFDKQRDSLNLPDEDTEFEMYKMLCKKLEQNGYFRYEISNFSKPGKQSRHNLRYWERRDYIGFGVAAHSCIENERFGNSRDIEAFLKGEDIVCEREIVDVDEKIEEYVILGLRLARGISENEYFALSRHDMYADMPSLKTFLKQGFLERHEERISFSDQGFFVSNTILAQLLEERQNLN